MAGLTTQFARDTLVRRLENFLQNPSVRIYFENFRVTLLGEVGKPGVYSVTNEKLSIPEAIGLAVVFGSITSLTWNTSEPMLDYQSDKKTAGSIVMAPFLESGVYLGIGFYFGFYFCLIFF